MRNQLTVSQLISLLGETIELSEVIEGESSSALIDIEAAREGKALLMGTLNLIHCNQIQIIGQTEYDYLQGLDHEGREKTLDWLFSCDTRLVVFVDGTPFDEQIKNRAIKSSVSLIRTQVTHFEIISDLRYIISEQLADRTNLHGVFLEVAGTGVLLIGEPGIGKSELALELVTRGHRLIADDAPLFAKISPNTLRGECPELLQDFLEVRGLGILNIRQMFGDNAIKPETNLELIVRLEHWNPADLGHKERWHKGENTREIMGVNVTEVLVPVAPGRNLAIMVEAAARNHLLRAHGYDSAQEFSKKLRHTLDNPEQ